MLGRVMGATLRRVSAARRPATQQGLNRRQERGVFRSPGLYYYVKFKDWFWKSRFYGVVSRSGGYLHRTLYGPIRKNLVGLGVGHRHIAVRHNTRSLGGVVIQSCQKDTVGGTSGAGSDHSQPKRRKKMKKLVDVSLNIQTNAPTLRPKALEIAERLQKLYPRPPIPLDHKTPFQLLCAVVLSAQTTDLKVNQCTPELFAMAPDAASMSQCDVKDIERCIASLGLAPTKAKNLRALSIQLMEDHGGCVPATFEELEALPGVGHKTASVVMSQVHGHPAFPVDTHIHRLAQRWGLTDGSSVEQTEADLKFLFPSDSWNDLHLQIIYFGREMCPAKGHDPATCPICSWAAIPPFDKAGASTTKPGQKSPSSKRMSSQKASAAQKKKRTE